MSISFISFEADLEALLAMLKEIRPDAEARATAVWLVRELAVRELGGERIGDHQVRALVRAVYPAVKARDPRVVPGWTVVCDLLRGVSARVGASEDRSG